MPDSTTIHARPEHLEAVPSQPNASARGARDDSTPRRSEPVPTALDGDLCLDPIVWALVDTRSQGCLGLYADAQLAQRWLDHYAVERVIARGEMAVMPYPVISDSP